MAKTALLNVRVFDGEKLSEPTTIVINGLSIGQPTDIDGAETIDAKGGVLLPGLIDAHVHLDGPKNLTKFLEHGVTTVMEMASFNMNLLSSLRDMSKDGMPTVLSAGIPATSPGSNHSRIPGFPPGDLLGGPEGAKDFVAQRVKDGSDYIKIIADIPGPSQEILDALVSESRAAGKKTVAHAGALIPTQMALKAGVDIITHVPLDQALDEASIEKMVSEKRISIPTLAMMEGIAKNRKLPPRCYEQSKITVRKMYEAGVPILLGTDANMSPGVPANVEHGSGLHHELELLVDAGLSPVDALRAATILPAKHFGLGDRGVIEPGQRADLVLIDGDPLQDIRATKTIRSVWCGGVRYIPDTYSS